jgi:hypothetical protein
MDKNKYSQTILIEEKDTDSEVAHPCGGKNCDRNGRFFLKIKYVNLHGWFCESCAADLKINDFIEFEPPIFEDQINCSVPVEKFPRLSQQVPSNSIGED